METADSPPPTAAQASRVSFGAGRRATRRRRVTWRRTWNGSTKSTCKADDQAGARPTLFVALLRRTITATEKPIWPQLTVDGDAEVGGEIESVFGDVAEFRMSAAAGEAPFLPQRAAFAWKRLPSAPLVPRRREAASKNAPERASARDPWSVLRDPRRREGASGCGPRKSKCGALWASLTWFWKLDSVRRRSPLVAPKLDRRGRARSRSDPASADSD